VNKHYLIVALLFFFSNCYAQQLSQVSFTQATDFLWFSLLTSQNVLIRVSAYGSILEYGTEQVSIYNPNQIAAKLIFTGAVSYYQQDPDSILNGKIKAIGTCYFTYYGSKDYPELAGKIRSAGNLFFDYYRNYEDALNAGKLKSIGSNNISYFDQFQNEAYRGKLKQVGNTFIAYYSSFGNPLLKGKLKSIGTYQYEWASTTTMQGFVYYLKTGTPRQLINGILYIPQ
jgi:hypothetical protein